MNFLAGIATTALALIACASDVDAQRVQTLATASLETLVKEGASVYRSRCAECHGLNGEGQWQDHDAAPRLAGKLAPLSVERIAVLIIQGGSYMPRFDSLTHREIAAVATFVRNSFGNSHGIVTEEEIAGFR